MLYVLLSPQQLRNARLSKEKLEKEIEFLNKVLERKVDAYGICQSLIATNAAVADVIRNGNPGQGDHLWLAVNIIDTDTALKQCDRSVQDDIATRIEFLKAQIAVLNDYIRKHGLCIELPIRLKEAG